MTDGTRRTSNEVMVSLLAFSLIATPGLAAQGQVFDITEFGASAAAGDDTAAIQAAFDKAKANPASTVKIPAGTFEGNGLFLWSNTTLEGVGPSSIIRTSDGGMGAMITVNPVTGAGATARLAEKQVKIQNLTLMGNTAKEGYRQHTDLLRFFGVETSTVSKVRFVGFRGDGLYIGDGLADKGVIRHNKDLIIEDCEFDGVNKQNRNGITVGDGENVIIRRCKFTRTTSDKSPGTIDIEQNKNNYHVTQNIQILDCEFNDNGGTGIVVDVATPQRTMKRPMNTLIFKRNKIRNQQRRGILLNQFSEFDATAAQSGVIVQDNVIEKTPIPIAIEGIQGIDIVGNTIRDTERGIMVGFGKKGRGTQNINIRNNTFERVGSDPKLGGAAVIILNALNVNVEGNTIGDLVGADPVVVLFAAASGGSRSGGVKISGNQQALAFRGKAPAKFRVGKYVEIDQKTIKVID